MSMEELRTLIARHTGEGVTEIADGVLISRHSRPGPPEYSTTGTLAVLMVQGAKRMALGDEIHEYRAGELLIASVDLPVTGHFTEASAALPALGFALALKPALIAELLLHAAGADFPRSARGAAAPRGLLVAPASDEIVDAATRMVRLIERPFDAAVLAPLVERELLWLLMRGPHGAAVRQLGLADSSLTRVGHAVRRIREAYTEPFRIEDLARMTSMSASAFHRTFHAVTGMSPIQFQKQIRLQEARIRLVADPGDVAGAAYAVGYESPSQFSRDYRRRFGAPPLRDAMRLRDVATAEERRR